MGTPFIIVWIIFLTSEVFAVMIIYNLHNLDLKAYWGTQDAEKRHNWQAHPIVMGLCMIVMNGHGMVLFRLLPRVKTEHVKYMHLLTYAFSFVGCINLYTPEAEGSEHEYHLHLYLSYFAVILFMLQFVGSFLIYVYTYTNQRRRRAFAHCHNFVGIVVLWVSVTASCEQLQYLYYLRKELNIRDDEYTAATICIVVYALLINSIVLNPYLEWRLVGSL